MLLLFYPHRLLLQTNARLPAFIAVFLRDCDKSGFFWVLSA